MKSNQRNESGTAVKKLLPLLLVLLLLSSCAGEIASQVVTPSPTPAPTPVSTPSAVVEGAEPDLLVVNDGEFCGVFASTGETVYPCEYRYLQPINANRISLGKYVSSEDNSFITSISAIGDLAGNQLTDFIYSYVQYTEDDCGLLYAYYADDADKAAILDAETCEPLMELPSSCNLQGGSAAAGTFILFDYDTRIANLYSISGLREGNLDPLRTLKNVAFLRTYDAKTGVGLFNLTDGSAAFFGGNGDFEAVFVDMIYEQYYGLEDIIPYLKNGFWGYADRGGKTVIKPQYEAAGIFSDGLAAVSLNGLFGYIDETGEMVIQPKFYEAGPFVGGFALAKDADGEGFLIDKTGTKVLSGVQYFYSISPETDMGHVEGVQQEDGSRRTWIVDDGRIIEVSLGNTSWVSSERMREGICAVSGYNEETSTAVAALIDTKTGNYISPPGEYNYFTGVQAPFNSKKPRADFFVGYRTVRNTHLCDLFDASGNRILVGLNAVYSVGEAVAAVRKGFSWGLMDFHGQWICSYSIFNSLERD